MPVPDPPLPTPGALTITRGDLIRAILRVPKDPPPPPPDPPEP